MSKIRILFIHFGTELYGSDRILIDILGFWQNSAEVSLMVPGDGLLIDMLKERKINATLIYNKNMPIISRNIFKKHNFALFIRNYFYTRKIMNSLKYDILYINTLACAIFLLYKKSVKIIHIHEILVNRLQIIIFGAIIKHFANVAIFVSNACQEKLKPYCKKSIVIHNGVRDIYYKDGFKKENDDDKIRCILIGRIMPEKGYWILADCISEMSSDDRQELEIMTVGSPPPTRPYLKDEFIDYLIKKGIDKNIKVLDFNPHIEDLINSADIVLVPSVMRDPFPTTVIEAMSAAKAVITTDGGGAMEIIKNKSNGIIIRRNNYADLLDALLYLINNRDIIRYLGENARETYKNDLCYESFRKRYSESILSSLSELLK